MRKIELISSFTSRGYQQSLFANTMKKNSLIVLPTGLGKTIIALMHAMYQFNTNNKKILFLAPTKPLVEQHELSFKELIKNKEDIVLQTLTGSVSPKKREEMYKTSDIIFSTPQLIENDIVNSKVPLEDFSLVIIDEAHRATGNYAYCFIAQEFAKSAQILALTASPGTSKEEIETVMSNLVIENIEVKKYEDDDVKPYVQDTSIEHIQVELTAEQKKIKSHLDKVISKKTQELNNLGVLKGSKQLSKREILELQSELRKIIGNNEAEEVTWKAISLAAALMKLLYGQELFDSQDFKAAFTYYHNFFREGGDTSKAAQELTMDIDFRDAYDQLRKLHEKNELHPKLHALKKIIAQEFETNPDNKIILFNQYRDTALHICEEIKSNSCKPVVFFGQNKKGNIGMSQKEQKRILDEFRSGIHNVLISTSVGEEGLDIPKVDTVIFYEPVPSAIRSIQRIGRTGRFNKGKAYVLQTKGTRDIATRYVASAKEKRMYSSLEGIKKDIQKKKQRGLSDFFEKKSAQTQTKKSTPQENSQQQQPINSLPRILVDSRENTDLIKKLFKVEEFEVEATQLTVGDIVISEDVAIERKAVGDFVSSLLDKRLFPQLIDLARNFKRPILLIEGEESLYAQRNIHPNVIRSAISSIAIDLRMPIIYTNSIDETLEYIKTIVKRQNKEKKALSLVSNKRGLSEIQEIEKVVSSIPKVNAITAKHLLEHFNSLELLAKASAKELEEVEGIGSIRAKYIYEFMRRKYNENN